MLSGTVFAFWYGFRVTMAALGEDSDAEQQHSLRVGDTILLYVKEVHGYVLSELSRSV